MQRYFYQIKGKMPNGMLNDFGAVWAFPPIYSGDVYANDSKDARNKINEHFGKELSVRILKTETHLHDYLLKIEDFKDHHASLFEERECIICKSKFRIIDKYNDAHVKDGGQRFCSDDCKEDFRRKDEYELKRTVHSTTEISPVIYKITNKQTGKCYIGKTTQVFTLRWYGHFFQTTGGKFQDAIWNSKYTDWTFEVIEMVEVPEETKKSISETERFILDRERFWINHYDSKNNGYNTV